MKRKNIALINYPGDYFAQFGSVLGRGGFNVFWVCINRSDAQYLLRNMSVPPRQVLDVNAGLKDRNCDTSACREKLAYLEGSEGPRIYDIIMMDRMLREKDLPFALQYLEHIRDKLSRFFAEKEISIVTSGRDSALQLMAMLVCRSMGIPWVVPTRLRIPKETYGFCAGHDADNFLRIRQRRPDDRKWSESVLENYQDTSSRPALKVAASSFKDVFSLIRPHFLHFLNLLKRSYFDRGNDFSRYTIPKIIGMYAKRRINMITFNIVSPWTSPGTGPFCIYALHTQPESSIDVAGSFFSDQIALIAFIARSLPVSHELYVKVHPTDVDGKTWAFYMRIKKIRGVRLIGADVDSLELIVKTSLVFTLAGTIGYEAGLRGKPVIAFAKNYFNALPTVHYCGSPPELPALVAALIDKPPPENWRSDVIEFLTDYRGRIFDGEVNRMYGTNPRRLTEADLAMLQNAYNVLFENLVISREAQGRLIEREDERPAI